MDSKTDNNESQAHIVVCIFFMVLGAMFGFFIGYYLQKNNIENSYGVVHLKEKYDKERLEDVKTNMMMLSLQKKEFRQKVDDLYDDIELFKLSKKEIKTRLLDIANGED